MKKNETQHLLKTKRHRSPKNSEVKSPLIKPHEKHGAYKNAFKVERYQSPLHNKHIPLLEHSSPERNGMALPDLQKNRQPEFVIKVEITPSEDENMVNIAFELLHQGKEK